MSTDKIGNEYEKTNLVKISADYIQIIKHAHNYNANKMEKNDP